MTKDKSLTRLAVFALAVTVAVTVQAQPARCESTAAELPALGADLSQTTVSGLSSGAYMAGQFQIAHSRIVIGAAIIAGGPYGCAEDPWGRTTWWYPQLVLAANVKRALNTCMQTDGSLDVDEVARRTVSLARARHIDPLSDLAGDKVYLFSGGRDDVVDRRVVEAARNLYLKLGVPADHIRFAELADAGHAFVTLGEGDTCSVTQAPYIVNCGVDQVGAFLSFFFGALNPPVPAPAGDFMEFNQQPFHRGWLLDSLAQTAVVYVPKPCREGGCRVHVAFHGCRQNRQSVGDDFIKRTGYARWADSNRMIVLFPQTRALPVRNPRACWDWWGYAGLDYRTKASAQIVAVYRMLQRLAEPTERH